MILASGYPRELLLGVCRDNFVECLDPSRTASGKLDIFDYRYSGSDYTQKNFHVIVIAILIWV